MKNENFFKNYIIFVEDLLQSGYAERSPNALEVHKWYIMAWHMACTTQLSQGKYTLKKHQDQSLLNR